MKLYYVYILKTVYNPSRYYVGFTMDLEKRLVEHNSLFLLLISPLVTS
ncbi:GIY-YIG nuclease family protein [Candidatus Paracaedibacter acanthamoebae]